MRLVLKSRAKPPERESEVLAWILTEHATKQIATELIVSQKTIEASNDRHS
ncbi:LuxR C-terminal-related transcriptional regulator [Prosthecobacter debontii]|uniref:LuxR C-terminal-related transcriptional regulator n=1 Tax=Prosthecobacter debontii TaxID=48467 RepID=UPI0009993969